MKRFLAILMMVAMLFSFAAAEDEDIMFSPTLLNIMEYSADQWFSSYTYQTAFAVMAAAELTSYEEQGIKTSSQEGILNDEIFVSINDEHNILTAFFFGNTQVIGLMYMPEAEIAMILVQPDITPEMSEAAMIAMEDQYVQIAEEDFLTVLNALAGE